MLHTQNIIHTILMFIHINPYSLDLCLNFVTHSEDLQLLKEKGTKKSEMNKTIINKNYFYKMWSVHDIFYTSVLDEKVSLGLPLANTLFSLWMIWTCLPLRFMVLSLPLSWSDSTWTSRDGMTEKLLVSISSFHVIIALWSTTYYPFYVTSVRQPILIIKSE